MKDVISRNYAAFIVYLPAQRVAERIIHLAVALTLQHIMLKPTNKRTMQTRISSMTSTSIIIVKNDETMMS